MSSANTLGPRNMNLTTIVTAFVVGGALTALITGLELKGMRTWSGLATLVPVFTLISYFIIGLSKDGQAVSQHAKFVLVGTIITWIPYMIAIILLAPRIGPTKAIGVGLSLFFILAGVFVVAVEKMNLFR